MIDTDKLKSIYNMFYLRGMWGDMGGGSKSGLGSSLEYTESYTENLVKIIDEYGIKNIFDCSCGDWFWTQHIKDKFENYIGNDITEQLILDNISQFQSENINFVCNDMLSQMGTYEDKQFDLIICRHTLEHLPTDYNMNSIKEMKRISKYGLITSSVQPDVKNNIDINVDYGYIGQSRSVNIELSPYIEELGKPILRFWDSVKGKEDQFGCFGLLYKF
jgi:ubiquinone/menaquinone biosynthesis C-methylase UbiE